MKKLTALVLLSFLAFVSVRADVIWQDTFNYSNGPVAVTSTNGTGGTTSPYWIRFSGTASPSDMYVNNRQLEVSSTSTYLGVTSTRQDDVGRLFATTGGSIYTNAHQALYVSFIMTVTNLPVTNGAYCAMFKYGVATSTSYEGKLWALQGNPSATAPGNFSGLPGTFRLGVSATGSTTASKVLGIDLALNTPYQVVVGWNPTDVADSDGNMPYGDAAYVWVNPVSSSDASAVSADAFTRTAAPANNIADDFGFRQATGFGGFFTVSNLVVATRFIEAVTNALVTNAVAPKIIYQPTAVTSNFVNATFALSAVANGQGLANMTYQWQVSATPDNASPQNVQDVSDEAIGYNANVLSFGSADSTDTGYYTLVATTPYGLSVTSSIAKVVISANPVPPAFITVPGNQTVYSGSSVTFSTSVSSPGNITFTWYSNNVVITAGQSDGVGSSTYVLGTVTTNYSGTYSVAVTNDVYATGIRTNFTLTVTNAPVVSIAYLRSLMDTTTFVTTSPLTQPFQVTGIITSYTNVTSGNTACYYLQDATAGIDIFATGGSTFRPQLGDVVTYVGVLSTYNGSTGGLELYADPNYPYTSYTVLSNNIAALPAGRVIPFTVTNDVGYVYLNTNLMGSRVTLTNVYFGTNAGTTVSTSANVGLIVTNASGLPFALEFYDQDLDTAGQTLPTFAYSVTGNLIGFHPNVLLAVTKFSDIVTNPPPPPPTIIPTISAGITSFSITPDGNVVITGTNGQATGVYYLLASANVSLPLSQWMTVATNIVNTNGANGAFTFTGTNVVTPGATNLFYILSNTNAIH